MKQDLLDMPSFEEIIHFWFEETEPKYWFMKDTDFDQLIAERFGEVYQQAIRCELSPWRSEPHGRLAEIIILDQFSRNLFRDDAQAFAHDSLALALSQEAVTAGAAQQLEPAQRAFLYMPFMHSESLVIHEQAVTLFSEPGLENNLDFEHRHKGIIERFGRYPHRNEILGRESTAEEIEFLKEPGSSF